MQFVWLNRHCFNGLCRFNSKGEFNSPFGRYSNPQPPELPSLDTMRCLNTITSNLDFRTFLGKFTFWENDVIYCDPPYVQSDSQSFVGYTKGVWGEQENIDLADQLLTIKQQTGAKIFVSNSITENTKKYYAFATNFHLIPAKRNIAADATKRGKVFDYLIEL